MIDICILRALSLSLLLSLFKACIEMGLNERVANIEMLIKASVGNDRLNLGSTTLTVFLETRNCGGAWNDSWHK